MYKENDEVVFQINDTILRYRVIKTSCNEWFLAIASNSNDAIFKALHINDKETFVVEASGYMLAHYDGSFPVIRCDNASGINRVIDALLQKCAETSSKPDTSSEPTAILLYKKGDVVQIITRDQLQNSNAYRFYFDPCMYKYCGQNYIVEEVSFLSKGVYEDYRIPDDGMLYKLKDADGKILPYNFASSMFESKLVLPQIVDKPIRRPDATVCTETKIHTNMYKKGDRITFQIGNDNLTYTVLCCNKCWLLSNCKGVDSEIFRKLKISDRFAFISKISQHMGINVNASFPEVYCDDETEINKVIDALLKECDKYNRHNRREIPYIPEQCATLEYKIKLGKPKNKYQLKFTN